jgi:Rieske Fe-S protein
MGMREVSVGLLDELDDPGCREFTIGDGDWPFMGFVVRHWAPHCFLTKDRSAIVCASHGALYDIRSGECFAGPCPGKALRRVDVDVRDGVVYVTGPVSM